MIEKIKTKIMHALCPTHLEIIDESHQHQGIHEHPTHLKVIIVSHMFDRLSLVKRHQNIYALLKGEMETFLHALSLHTYTPEEWTTTTPETPTCRGGFQK